MTKKSKILYTIFLLILLFVPPLIAYNYYELPGIKGYKPPEGFPWNWEPKTAEQIMYIYQASEWAAGIDDTHFGVSLEMNKRGHISYYQWLNIRQHLYKDYEEVMLPLVPGGAGKSRFKPGDVIRRQRTVYVYPPEQKFDGFTWWDYLDTPSKRSDADTWLYLHSLRRVRRLAGGERADSVGGTLFAYDDIMGREIFEHEYKILGEYKMTDFPWDLNYAHLFESNWTPPEEIDTIVVLSKPKIPDYYLSQRILWFDKKRNMVVREEQYDKSGYLWKIFLTQRHDETDPKTGKKFLSELGFKNHYDPNIEFRSMSLQQAPERGKQSFGDSWFLPDAMKNEQMWRKPVTLYPPPPPQLKPADLIRMTPPLYVGLYPEYRKFRPDTLKRLGVTK